MSPRAVAAGVALASALACAAPTPAPTPADARGGFLALLEAGVGERTRPLEVRLEFGAEADLDLYVIDPLLETVYFANREARSGGRLLADEVCGGAGPRVEIVRFERALPGRYRVGIDHTRRCDGAPGAARWAIQVTGPGLERTTEGSTPLDVFEPVVLDFEIGLPN